MAKINRTLNISEEYNEIFEERRKELGLTVTAYFEHIIDTEHKKAMAATPVEVVKDNPEHLTKIKDLESQMESLKEFNETQMNEEKEKYARLVKVYEDLKRESENLQERKFAKDDEIILKLDPINVQILNYVAIREGNKRKQEWSISDVINYFVYYRFEKGTLNGGFDSVPDRIINQMRKELENA